MHCFCLWQGKPTNFWKPVSLFCVSIKARRICLWYPDPCCVRSVIPQGTVFLFNTYGVLCIGCCFFSKFCCFLMYMAKLSPCVSPSYVFWFKPLLVTEYEGYETYCCERCWKFLPENVCCGTRFVVYLEPALWETWRLCNQRGLGNVWQTCQSWWLCIKVCFVKN